MTTAGVPYHSYFPLTAKQPRTGTEPRIPLGSVPSKIKGCKLSIPVLNSLQPILISSYTLIISKVSVPVSLLANLHRFHGAHVRCISAQIMLYFYMQWLTFTEQKKSSPCVCVVRLSSSVTTV